MKKKILYNELQKYVKGKDEAVLYYVNSFLNKTLAMFEYENLPKGFNIKAVEKTLQTNGVIGWLKHDNELYALQGTAGGEMDANYQPTKFIISNPYLKLNKEYTIGEDLVVMKNDFMQMGMMPIIGRYAVLLTDADISLHTIATMARVTMLISAPDDKTKASADTFIDKILDGDFSVIGDGAFFDGVKMQTPPTSGNNSITQLIELIQYHKASFYNEIGLNANYNMKRERLTMGELQVNVDALLPFADNMLYERKEAIRQVNDLFGTTIEVDFSSAWRALHEEAENLRLEVDNRLNLHPPTDDTHENNNNEKVNNDAKKNNGSTDTNGNAKDDANDAKDDANDAKDDAKDDAKPNTADKGKPIAGVNDSANDNDNREDNDKNDTDMTKFNYFYDGIPITKEEFEKNVPKDWQNDLDELGNYSSGYYSAKQKD